MAQTVDEASASPSGPTIVLVVCTALVLLAVVFGVWLRWMRTVPPSHPQFRPMNISDSDDPTPVGTVDNSAPQQTGRVGANHPVPMYSPVAGTRVPSGPGVVGVGGKPVAPGVP